MDNLINDFSKFAKEEFDVEFKPNELKKIIGNNTAMFKTFQIIMLKFKSKSNGELIKKKLEFEDKKSKFNELISDLNKLQDELSNLIKVMNDRKKTVKQDYQLKEFFKFKQIRNKQLIKLFEQVLKSNEIEIDPTVNLNKIDKNIDLLNLKANLEDIDVDKPLPPQLHYSLVEKQIEEFIKDINGSIYEITELMKNEDFTLELENDFIENLTRTDYKVNDNQIHENTDIKNDKLMKLNKHYEIYKERIDNLCKKHKNKVYDLIKKVEEQTNKQ